MSKVSFRARALDVSKPMPIFRSEEIPDMRDFDKINRAVLQMPTGMEKEEETETHLQKALTAQQFYGTAEARAIPIPEVQRVDERYNKMYTPDFKLPKQYIHIQALGMEQEIPDYDLDSEDEAWLTEQTKKMEITSIKFEEMMDRLEKGSGQQVVTLPEAKCLLKEDDDLIIAVYDYWLNKRLRLEMPLIPQVKSEKRDGTTTNNPYVAFRRRTEKMQTRKNRKNDETSYEKMVKLKRDMQKALLLTQFLKRREKSKKENLQLSIEILAKRYQMADFNGINLAEAEAEQAKMPSTFIAPFTYSQVAYNGEEVAPVRKKRQYKRRQKQAQQAHHPHATAAAIATAASFGDVDVLYHDMDTSDDDMVSPAMSPSDHEDENDPDGPFAFKRRKNCSYYAPRDGLGNWPWSGPQEGGKADPRYRFSLTCLPASRCIGFARRRVGRGGRVILDRGFTPWDEGLDKLDLESGQSYSSRYGDYITYIRERKIPFYRPQTPPPDERGDKRCSKAASPCGAVFNAETYSVHCEQLMERQRQQQQQWSQDYPPSSSLPFTSHARNSGNGLQRSFSSQPTSHFKWNSVTPEFSVPSLDFDHAQFAVTALSQLQKEKNKKRVKQEGAGDQLSASGDAGHVTAVSDAAVTIPSSSLVSSLPSVISSAAPTPVSFSTRPSIMATKALSLASTPAAGQLPAPVSLSSLTTASLLSLTSQSVNMHRVTANGPVCASPAPSVSSLIHTAISRTSATGAPPSSSSGSLYANQVTAAGKLMSNKVAATCVPASTGMCSLATSSPVNILKAGLEEGGSAVQHLFNADTPMAMDVS